VIERWTPHLAFALCLFYTYTTLWLAVWVVVPSLVMRWEPVLVTSDSMEPRIQSGDLLLIDGTDRSSPNIGDVITFQRPGLPGLVTHRIVESGDGPLLVTRGDANPVPDSTQLDPTDIVGRPRLVVSVAGMPILWLQQGRYLLVAGWAAGTLGALAYVTHYLRRHRQSEGGGDETPSRELRPHWWNRVATRRLAVVAAAVAMGSMLPVETAASFNDTTANQSSLTASEWEQVLDLSGGLAHTCAAVLDGSVWCWGRNDKGQLGDGSTSDSSVPVELGVSGVVAVTAGDKHSCAVLDDGSVWCWGSNNEGQLGNNTTSDSWSPVGAGCAGGSGTLSGVVAVAAGEVHSCAVLDDGSVWCWGRNDKGQLGDDTGTDSESPVQVAGAGGSGTLSGVVAVAAGDKHSCAVLDDGSVWCWGSNNEGQLGNNTTSDSWSPVGAGSFSSMVGVTAGEVHSCAVSSGGGVWCWGRNDKGQLGDDTGTDSESPVQVKGAGGSGALSGVVDLGSGQSHTCAATSSGAALCWGQGDKGQLGNNATAGSGHPVQVVGPGGSGTLTDVVLVGAGEKHSCAAIDIHTVYCWGDNAARQLGDGTTNNTDTPALVVGT
jgi:signal peptidase I